MKFISLFAAFSLVGLTGCGYTIHGVVVRGDMSSVEWEDGNAGGDRPVPGASVSITRDPTTLHPEIAGSVMTDAHGCFELPVSGFGAGWMNESWLIRASRNGVGSAEWLGELPGSPSGRTLVIVISPDGGRSVDASAMWK